MNVDDRTPRQNVGHVSRRDILRVSGAAVSIATVTASCDLLSTDPSGSSDRPAADSGQRDSGSRASEKEAPSLAKEVQAGTLPPLHARIPETPLVIQPVQQTGSYGGEWHTATLEGDYLIVYGSTSYDGLVRWNTDWSEVIPNVAESVDVDESGREFTFSLRDGMKWSDGHAFTADDIAFAYNDVLRNTDIFPVFPEKYQSIDGKPAKLEKVDAHTVRFSFASPNGLFLQYLAGIDGQHLTLWPKHHVKKFLKK